MTCSRFLTGRPVVAVFALTILSPGCTAWHVQPGPVAQAVPQRPNHIWVIHRDGLREELFDAEVRHDTLVGFPTRSRNTQSPLLAMPTANIDAIAVRRLDPLKTGLLIGALYLVVRLGEAAMAGADFGPNVTF